MIIRAAVAGMLLLIGAASPATAAPVTVLTPGTIAGSETIEDSTVILAGTVTVPGSLTIRRARIVAMPGSSIDVAGTLVMTDVDAEGLGLTITGDAFLTRTALAHSANDLVVVSGGSLTAHSTTLSGAGIIALRAMGASIDADDLTVTGTNGYGIRLADSAFTATGLSIASAIDYGLFAERSTIDIDGASFDGHCGAYLAPGTTGSVRNAAFTTDDHGLTLFRSGSLAVRDVSFVGGRTGLTAVGVVLNVADITSTGQSQGMLAIDATGSVTGGTLTGPTGVEIDGPLATSPTIRDVDLSGAVTGVRNLTAAAVDARWNWWGGTPGAGGAAGVAGPVTVSPWLTGPPA